MFAKLKKKIVEEEGVGEGELNKKYVPGQALPQRPADGSPTSRVKRGSTASLSSHGSSSSLSTQAIETKKGSEATGDNNLQSEPAQRNDQVRRLESKLDEYSAMLKEVVKAKERLETALEKQEEDNTKKMQELNEEYQLRRAKMVDKLSLAVQRKEDEMNVQIEALQKERTDLQDQLQRLSMDKFKKQEESEELQGFQVQELAKVKHMFVNSQQELHKCRADLDHSQERLEESGQRVQRLTAELGQARESLARVRHTRDELTQKASSAEESSGQWERTAKGLEERLQSSAIEHHEMSKRILTLEERLTGTQEELDALRHESEVHKTQAASQLGESESTSRHLQEKVKMLEQRLQDHSLTDDEQLQAVMAERDTLEQKLETSRRELIDVKGSAADKISNLEQQISHLNAKMAEDTEEALRHQQDQESIGRRHSKELGQLRVRLEQAEQRALAAQELAKQRETDHAQQKLRSETELATTQEELADAKRQSLDTKKTLQDKIAALESKITSLNTATNFEKSATEHKITRLESQNEEYLEREIEHEKHVTTLEDEKDALAGSLSSKSKENECLTKELAGIKDKVEDMTKQTLTATTALMDTHKEIDRLRKLMEERDTTIHQSDQECEDLKRRNTELSSCLDAQERESQAGHDQAQRALFDRNETISVLRETVAGKEQELEQSQAKVQELEDSLAAHQAEMNGVDEAEQDVDKLKQALADAEQQLTEKNKTIKMQQQRLADLKKTLQRELKLQSSTGYDSPEEHAREREKSQLGGGVTSSQPVSAKLDGLVPLDGLGPMGGVSGGSGHGGLTSLIPNPRSSALYQQDLREVNFQYLRHVVFKFMSSTDSEAKQLLKAVSTLLEFTPHEERLINSTLEWKTSWFGVRPSPKKTIQVSSLAYR